MKRLRHIPIQPYLTALFAVLTLAIGISTAVLFYDRMKTASINDANVAFGQVSTKVAQQLLQARLEVEYALALATAGELAKAPTSAARQAASLDLWPLLNSTSLGTAAYAGFPNGDFILLRRRRASDQPPAALRGSAVYLMRTVEHDGARTVARLSYLDRNRKTISVADTPEFHFDPRTRPWFGARTATVAFTPPYLAVSPTGNRIGYTFSLRAASGSVFGVDLDLDSTSGWLAGLLPTPSSVAAAVTVEGAVVFVYSDHTTLGRVTGGRATPPKLYDMHSAPLEAAYADAQGRAFADTRGTITADHRLWLYGASPARTSDGKVALFPVRRGGMTVYEPRSILVIAAPEDEVIAAAVRVRNEALGLCAALLLAIIPLAYWFSRLISRPLNRLRRDALALRNLDLEERPQRNSLITEVDEFAETFGAMRSHIREHNAAVANFIPHHFLELLGHSSLKSLQLGDHRESVMTMLVADIRSFTTISGSMTPGETFQFVNTYLAHIGPIVREQNGFIDKYIGDAIFALFPGGCGDAVDAAISMQHGIVTYNEARAREGLAPIAIGIGLHHDNLMLGTIGEPLRFETTVISKAVDITAQLEDLTKTFGALILASADVADNVDRAAYHMRRLGDVVLTGTAGATTIYEICDADPYDLLAHKIRTKDVFEQGRIAYGSGELMAAARIFGEVVADDERDQAAAYFRDNAIRRTATAGVG